jgi:hypothetical protein
LQSGCEDIAKRWRARGRGAAGQRAAVSAARERRRGAISAARDRRRGAISAARDRRRDADVSGAAVGALFGMPPFSPDPPDAGHDEPDDVLLDRLTALARVIDPLPASVAAAARGAGAAAAR